MQAAQKLELAERQRAERDVLQERFRPLPLYKQWQEQAQIVGLIVHPVHAQEATREQQPEKLSQVMRSLSHTIDRRGHITYRSAGKDLFRDEGRILSVLDAQSERAIAAALATAQQKFGNLLTLTGSAEFQKKAVAVAVANNLNVRFTDPALNALGDRLQMDKRHADAERTRIAAAQRLEAEKDAAAALAKTPAAEKAPQEQKERQIPVPGKGGVEL